MSDDAHGCVHENVHAHGRDRSSIPHRAHGDVHAHDALACGEKPQKEL